MVGIFGFYGFFGYFGLMELFIKQFVLWVDSCLFMGILFDGDGFIFFVRCCDGSILEDEVFELVKCSLRVDGCVVYC